MWETPNNSADWDCFRTLTLPWNLTTQKSTSGGTLCFFVSHTFAPKSWMCKKQTSVSRSSTEYEMISVDAGLRRDGIPALDLWDPVAEVLHMSPDETQRLQRVRRDLLLDKASGKRTNAQSKTQIPKECLELSSVDHVSSIVKSSRPGATVYIYEDTEAVIKMIFKGRSPTMWHVSRTHRVALDWLFDSINLDPRVQIKYVDTKNQLTDILIIGNFTRDEWNISSLFVKHQQFQLFNHRASAVEKINRKEQQKKELQPNQSPWWIWYRRVWQSLQQRRLRVHLQAQESQSYQSLFESSGEYVETGCWKFE